MRVGIDAIPLSVPSGGIRRYTEELIDGLSRINSNHRYVLYHAGRSPLERGRFDGLECDPIAFTGKRFVDALHLIGAHRRIDLYHGTNYSIPLWTRIPTVVTIHDLTVQLAPETHPFARRMRHLLLPAICRRATRLIADSGQTRDDLIRHFGLDGRKIDVIHLAVGSGFHPVSDSRELARVRQTYGLPERFLLYLGAIEPRKNLETLIDAFSILRRDGDETSLVIAGSGLAEYESKLRARSDALGLVAGREIVFAGHIEEADLSALYCASELFVFPSNYEGFGLPPAEAMACGIPVALARNSSLTEVYAGTCAMFDGSDPNEIATVIRKTLGDESGRSERVRKGLEFAHGRTWDRVCAETQAVYERAAMESNYTAHKTTVR